jgi:hypothetical protein
MIFDSYSYKIEEFMDQIKSELQKKIDVETVTDKNGNKVGINKKINYINKKNDQLDMCVVSEYNKKGWVQSQIEYDYGEDGKLFSRSNVFFIHNHKGVLLGEDKLIYNENSILAESYAYSYDDNGRERLRSYKKYDADGRLTSEVYNVFSYDDNGRKKAESFVVYGEKNRFISQELKIYEYDNYGNLKSKIKREYRDDARFVKSEHEEIYDKNGICTLVIQRDYDDNENLKSEIQAKYDADKKLISARRDLYIRDGNGLVKLKIQTKYGADEKIISARRDLYIRDGNGLVKLKIQTKYGADEKIISVTRKKYEYNETGLMKSQSQSEYGADEKLISETQKEYEYNEKGWMKSQSKREYDADEKLISKTNYIYQRNYKGEVYNEIQIIFDGNDNSQTWSTDSYSNDRMRNIKTYKKYSENKKLISEINHIYTYDDNGKIKVESLAKNDGNGGFISEELNIYEYYNNGSVKSKIKREYECDARFAKSEHEEKYSEDGKLISITEKKYGTDEKLISKTEKKYQYNEDKLQKVVNTVRDPQGKILQASVDNYQYNEEGPPKITTHVIKEVTVGNELDKLVTGMSSISFKDIVSRVSHIIKEKEIGHTSLTEVMASFGAENEKVSKDILEKPQLPATPCWGAPPLLNLA